MLTEVGADHANRQYPPQYEDPVAAAAAAFAAAVAGVGKEEEEREDTSITPYMHALFLEYLLISSLLLTLI